MPRKIVDNVESLEIKVTHLGNGLYGCRLYSNGKLIETRNNVAKSLIGATCRDMLRWQDKMGSMSPMAHASRHRAHKKEMARHV